MESKNLGLPILGAIVAAVVGGVVWALIAIITDYEIGFVAWAIGGLTAYAVFYFSKGNITSVH
jgi:hypothetical protein